MRRFLLVLSGIATSVAIATAPAAAAAPFVSATAASVSATTGCVSAAAATYRHSFDGAAGTATITATRALCSGQSQTFSLVSYTTGAPGTASGQFIYETARGTITATNRSVTLKAAVPSCYTQVEAFFGATFQTESTSGSPLYGSAKLGSATGAGARSKGPLAWYAGGSTACTARPAVSFTNACDGTFTAQLSNSGGTPAVFVTGSRRIRIYPGSTTTLHPAKGSTLTIRDSSFTTYIASWRAPAEGCTTTPTASPTTATPLPASTATTTATPTATATSSSPSPSASSSTYETAAPAFSTSPAALAPATSSDTTAGGMSLTSFIAIVMGLLMIGTGIAAITWLIRTNRRFA
ncbi:hypothetical protein [Actinoplanes sp. NPDC026619]|uniref:hypothetical protein n=1 Tax=Actinoplanes sp. NPDC026619 TaxID=3155798 RepID=UPI0033FAB85A